MVLASLPAAAQDLQITYLGNEGVLVEGGGRKVLIDALFRDSLDPYLRYPAEVQERLETGREPYHGVRLALATHFHLDHWDAGAISRFLRSNPQAIFASTAEGTAMIPRALESRVKNLWPPEGGSAKLDHAGVQVTAFPLAHGQTQNLGYRLVLGGRTLAHLGDADPSEENFRKLRSAGTVDVALVPYWWLRDPGAAAFLRDVWKPKNVIALHFGTTDAAEAGKIRAQEPAVWAATRQFETRKY